MTFYVEFWTARIPNEQVAERNSALITKFPHALAVANNSGIDLFRMGVDGRGELSADLVSKTN